MSKITEICCKLPIKYGLLQTEIIDNFYELGFDNQNIDESISADSVDWLMLLN